MEFVNMLNTSIYSLTLLERELLDLNISRAYEFNKDLQRSRLYWDPKINKFKTHYYLPPNSILLKIPSKEQIEHFKVEINGLRLSLISILKLLEQKGNFWLKTGRILDVEFIATESNRINVISRFRDGQIQLVNEKKDLP